MTQDDFFGAIESNLTSLAADHVPLPAEGGDGRRFLGLFGRRNAGRIKQVLNLTSMISSSYHLYRLHGSAI